MKVRRHVLSMLSAVAVVGCASSSAPARKAARSPHGRLLQDACAYWVGLKDQGQLAGFRGGEHGHLTSEPAPLSSWGEVTFPFSVILHAKKDGDDSFYLYTLMKHD